MVFTLPSLPSLSSLSSLLDSEPQVLYPHSATNTPAPSPSKNARTRNLPPVPDDWAEEREKQRGRRNSLASTSRLAPTSTNLPRSNSTVNVSTRPGHRRAHSALPSSSSSSKLSSLNTSTPITQLPLGRLTEVSRNKLASTSALSLPTLAEMEADEEKEEGESAIRRRSSGTSLTSSYTNNSDVSSLPPSPRRTPRHGHMMSLPNPGNVPPPIPRSGYGDGGGRLARPAPSPRCWSAMDVRPTASLASASTSTSTVASNPKGGLSRRSSYSTTTATTGPCPRISERTGSNTQVSDVAVLASWSFPSTPPAPDAAKSGRPRMPLHQGGSTSNLAERLKSLATLETRPSSLGLSISEIEPLPPLPALVPRYGHAPGMGMQQKLSHRYTHSSPNLAIVGTRGRGFRQPIPLGSANVLNSNTAPALSSSPGGRSLLSSSDTSSSEIGPPSPASSLHSLPPQTQLANEQSKAEGRWYDPRRAWSRRGSIASVSQIPDQTGVTATAEDDDGEMIKVVDDGDSDEEYLNYGEF